MATSQAVRMKILDVANTEYPGWVPRNFLLQAVENVAAGEIDRAVFYLCDKGYLERHGELGKPWTEIKITAAGIDVTEGTQGL